MRLDRLTTYQLQEAAKEYTDTLNAVVDAGADNLSYSGIDVLTTLIPAQVLIVYLYRKNNRYVTEDPDTNQCISDLEQACGQFDYKYWGVSNRDRTLRVLNMRAQEGDELKELLEVVNRERANANEMAQDISTKLHEALNAFNSKSNRYALEQHVDNEAAWKIASAYKSIFVNTVPPIANLGDCEKRLAMLGESDEYPAFLPNKADYLDEYRFCKADLQRLSAHFHLNATAERLVEYCDFMKESIEDAIAYQEVGMWNGVSQGAAIAATSVGAVVSPVIDYVTPVFSTVNSYLGAAGQWFHDSIEGALVRSTGQPARQDDLAEAFVNAYPEAVASADAAAWTGTYARDEEGNVITSRGGAARLPSFLGVMAGHIDAALGVA